MLISARFCKSFTTSSLIQSGLVATASPTIFLFNNEITNYYLCYDEYFFIDTIITVSPPSPYITSEYYRYHVYQDEEHAQEYFEELSENRREMYGSNAEWCIEDDYCYVIYSMDGTERYADYGAAINELESRYDTDELVLYGGVYYYDTTIISVQRLSDNEEDIEETRDFLDALGLPHM